MPEFSEPIDVDPTVAEANRRIVETIPPNSEDFEDARRGLLALPSVPAIPARRQGDRVVWNFAGYDFLSASEVSDAPPTVNASLWRQGLLTAQAGLFQVTSYEHGAIYQVRGYDLSNMTIIEGDSGIVVIDPLASYETAQWALKLYRDTTGSRRPIVGIIYTHSHVDHFGGARGLFHERDDVVDTDIPIIAPDGFLEHAVSENVYAGPAMARRSEYMYAAKLDKGPHGQIGAGLGLTISTGEVTLIPPNVSIGGSDTAPVPRDQWSSKDVIPWRPGLYRQLIDGIRLIFQLTPGTEAPAEMNIYLPQGRALCAAENATHTLHNLLTLRGAQVRDAHAWSKYLTETIQTFGEHTDVEFASHHWPRWRKEDNPTNIVDYLSIQRDVYAYLNDQSLRLINAGRTGIEIAEDLELPEALTAHWYTRGYYGSLSHDLKAVYQRYMGWFDGNPAHLWNLPPSKAGVHYVEAMGGVDAVVATAQQAYDRHEYRWTVELLNHVIFGHPADSASAKELQQKALTQLGYGSENGTWRNFYLTGADELAHGVERPANQEAGDLVLSMSLEQYFSTLARTVDGPTAAREQRDPIVLQWLVSGAEEETCTTTLRNGVLVYVPGKDRFAGTPQTVIKLSREALNGLMYGPTGFTNAFDAAVRDGVVQIPEGKQEYADTVFGYLTAPDPSFPIVAPAESDQ
ncbi:MULTISPECIES: alkyl/aryl-sulfatase [Streptomyces]|uniref:alkyl/aryl-sulfatase n=1 Tax=Streptomyces TaxID=1883 RepID=UPI001962462A|nr:MULTISPECIES: alkyl sulfatase dimerization domain-containing protein [Streptomyces]QRX89664.1 MBL fold metallo-hydrolase [Streptomyces noursei]UJB39681.1 MBL fold metallo-hydrolase [Streptomyces sp. A1-5]